MFRCGQRTSVNMLSVVIKCIYCVTSLHCSWTLQMFQTEISASTRVLFSQFTFLVLINKGLFYWASPHAHAHAHLRYGINEPIVLCPVLMNNNWLSSPLRHSLWTTSQAVDGFLVNPYHDMSHKHVNFSTVSTNNFSLIVRFYLAWGRMPGLYTN